MNPNTPEQLSLSGWDGRYAGLCAAGLREPAYGGALRRHAEDGDTRLFRLLFDNSVAALNLWNFLLTEEDRLRAARAAGRKIAGVMKDLGTVPVMAYALPDLVAFYPDGAWWIPCFKEFGSPAMAIADSLGIDDSFCPVRAMLGAFVLGSHFPIPDLLVCSAGAICDDFSAIAQVLNGLGHPIYWWEIPHRRTPEAEEPAVRLPGGRMAPMVQVNFVKRQLEGVALALGRLAGEALTPELLQQGIRSANVIRRVLADLRYTVFTADVAPLPALEMLIAEMLVIHFCSDREETLKVLNGLLEEVHARVRAGAGYAGPGAVKLFWVNPVADLKAMNMLEQAGGRLCGTDYLFMHALDPICETGDPLTALACSALADPMAGSAADRACRIVADIKSFGSEGLVLSKIPGASHCAMESAVIRRMVEESLDIPVLEIEIPSVSDGDEAHLRTQLEALVETVRARRR